MSLNLTFPTLYGQECALILARVMGRRFIGDIEVHDSYATVSGNGPKKTEALANFLAYGLGQCQEYRKVCIGLTHSRVCIRSITAVDLDVSLPCPRYLLGAFPNFALDTHFFNEIFDT